MSIEKYLKQRDDGLPDYVAHGQSSGQRHLPLPLHIYHERYGSLTCNEMCHQYLLSKMLDIHDTHVHTNLPRTPPFSYLRQFQLHAHCC